MLLSGNLGTFRLSKNQRASEAFMQHKRQKTRSNKRVYSIINGHTFGDKLCWSVRIFWWKIPHRRHLSGKVPFRYRPFYFSLTWHLHGNRESPTSCQGNQSENLFLCFLVVWCDPWVGACVVPLVWESSEPAYVTGLTLPYPQPQPSPSYPLGRPASATQFSTPATHNMVPKKKENMQMSGLCWSVIVFSTYNFKYDLNLATKRPW